MSAFTAKGFMFIIFMFIINDMNTRRQSIKLPTIVLAGSLIFITLLTLMTDPIRSITWAILFFLLLFVILMSFSSTIIILQKGELTPKVRHRLVLGTSFLIICLMLRSAGSLSLVDAFVLILIFTGSIFYFSRRH
jgi:hypothetical protein